MSEEGRGPSFNSALADEMRRNGLFFGESPETVQFPAKTGDNRSEGKRKNLASGPTQQPTEKNMNQTTTTHSSEGQNRGHVQSADEKLELAVTDARRVADGVQQLLSTKHMLIQAGGTALATVAIGGVAYLGYRWIFGGSEPTPVKVGKA